MTTASSSATEPLALDAPKDTPSAVAEDVTRVLEIASRADGAGVDPLRVARTAARVHNDLGRARHPFLTLAATCAEHGFSATALRAQPATLLDRIDEGVTLVVERNEPAGWVVLSLSSGAASVEVHEVVEGNARRLSRSAQRVLDALGADETLVDALALEASFPLDVLRAGGGGPSGALRKLLTLARLERSELTAVLVYAIFIGLLTLLMPVSVQALVNTIAFGSVVQPLVILGVVLFAGLLLSAVLQGLRHYVVEVIQRRIFARVVNDFGRRLPRWSEDVRRARDPRELINRFFEVVTVQKAFASLAVDALGLTLQTAMGLLLLAFYHPVLLAFDVVLVLALIALVLGPLHSSVKSAMVESKAKYATVAWLESVAEHSAMFSDARGARQASARAEALSRRYLDAREVHWRHLLQHIAGGLALHVVASVALLLIGGWLVMQRQLTLGQLVASELVVAAIGAGFAKLGKQMEKLYDATASVEKLSQVIDVPRERDGGLRITATGPARVELGAVSDPRLMAALDFSIAAGEKLGVTGPSASGKTTLLHLMTGRLQPSEGNVRVDGVDLAEADLARFRTDVFWLDDEARAPDLTVAELLLLSAPAASTGMLRDALARVGLGDVVERLSEGLDTRLLPHGGPLSKTELLRLSVARLLLAEPRLLLVDQALDALADDEAVVDAVLSGPWTAVVVTRRDEVLRRVDRVLELTPSVSLPPSSTEVTTHE